jgi:hypothetical protein
MQYVGERTIQSRLREHTVYATKIQLQKIKGEHCKQKGHTLVDM